MRRTQLTDKEVELTRRLGEDLYHQGVGDLHDLLPEPLVLAHGAIGRFVLMHLTTDEAIKLLEWLLNTPNTEAAQAFKITIAYPTVL